MDIKKDNSGGGLNPFTDNTLGIQAYFRDNEKLYLIFKKTERIVSAVFLITNLLNEQEPLRKALREKALRLLSVTLQSKDFIELLTKEYIHLSTLLRVAQDVGFVSPMNYQIISREIGAVETTIKEYMPKDSGLFLNQDFFEVRVPDLKIPQLPSMIKDNLYKGQSNVLYNVRNKQHILRKDINTDVKDNKNDRRQKILTIIAKKTNCSIKDFSHVITDYSEKTIQRELGAMVQEGILVKNGEKRWSTYQLKNA
jgi:hypothetical protein